MTKNFCFRILATSKGSFFKLEETYQIEGKKYLCCSLCNTGFAVFDEPGVYLLVPDDNSTLTNTIRNKLEDKEILFSIPLADLEFRQDFGVRKENDSRKIQALKVKNTGQVKETTENQRSAWEITFKVLSQKIKKINHPDPRCYLHELEVKPFSLGIEGLPEISKIFFDFGYPQTFEGATGCLIRTKFHNSKSKLLEESAGKTFSMKVKHWKIKRSDNFGTLYFNDSQDLEVDSFREITEIPEKKPTLKEEINRLQEKFKSVKSKLGKISNTTKKSELENKIYKVEGLMAGFGFRNMDNLDQPVGDNQEEEIKKIEQEIKEVEKKLEEKFDEDNKNNSPKPKKNQNEEKGLSTATKIWISVGIGLLVLLLILIIWFLSRLGGKENKGRKISK